ncbi:MAG: penicillin-binding protein 2 [Acidimicrobiales bacterium]
MSNARSSGATNPSGPNLRLNVIGIVVISLFVALVTRLWYLQVMAGSEYKLAAEQNQVRTIYEPAPRGRILDRDGKILVDNRISNVIAIDRSKLDGLEDKQSEEVIANLARLVGMTVEEVNKGIASQRIGPFTPVPIAEDVSEDLLVQVRERQQEFPGVLAKRVAIRSYPEGRLASHVLGYVGEINSEELKERGGLYQPGDLIGRSGVESTYESDLRGVAGERQIEVDRRGRPVRVINNRPPVQGNDLVLSIDFETQLVAEQALAQSMTIARGRRFEDDGKWLKANAGSVVVLDAQEGSVVAMASAPDYDPVALVDGISVEENVLLNQSEDAPFLNRAIQGEYAPGSTWKLVTGLAALRTGLIAPNYTVNDTGTYKIKNCIEGCTKRNAGSHPYGSVDMRRAMAVSSDVFFYSLGDAFWARRNEFGKNPMQDMASELGFGANTGVQLPNERNGRLLTPDALKKLSTDEKTAKLFPFGDWYVGNNVNFAIGQGETTVTPIQLANAYATFVNGGVRYQPNIALRVDRQAGEGEPPVNVRTISPRIEKRLSFAPEVSEPIMAGLIDVTRFGVTATGDGTAAPVFDGFPLAQYPIAGKTGTAQATPKQDTALFVAAAPANAPRYVVSVIVEQGGFGSTTAAPVARKIFGLLSGLDGGAVVQPVTGSE